jgi:hypothetical protein
MKDKQQEITEAYVSMGEAKKISDKELIEFGMDEFLYSKKDAKEWVDSMDKAERKEHEAEINARKQGITHP